MVSEKFSSLPKNLSLLQKNILFFLAILSSLNLSYAQDSVDYSTPVETVKEYPRGEALSSPSVQPGAATVYIAGGVLIKGAEHLHNAKIVVAEPKVASVPRKSAVKSRTAKKTELQVPKFDLRPLFALSSATSHISLLREGKTAQAVLVSNTTVLAAPDKIKNIGLQISEPVSDATVVKNYKEPQIRHYTLSYNRLKFRGPPAYGNISRSNLS